MGLLRGLLGQYTWLHHQSVLNMPEKEISFSATASALILERSTDRKPYL